MKRYEVGVPHFEPLAGHSTVKVIDTRGWLGYFAICETGTVEAAQLIADALNHYGFGMLSGEKYHPGKELDR